ncbi:MAG: hypothetical protein DCF25_03080 [Leptolyngbya foveolarum]|uniref:Aspartyl protease n=1 Tax=Leptolyngbya foveolarum TaxID=47253 RepID=A0A2W4USR5_9CYAN|nr:MAG: hypothetical protein DCF25_03080 [Leptolyngbya foveolarum]
MFTKVLWAAKRQVPYKARVQHRPAQGKLRAAIAHCQPLNIMGQPASSYRFILLPSLVGLFCYACSQTPEISANDRAIATTDQASTGAPDAILSTAPSIISSLEATSPVAATDQPENISSPAVSLAYQAGINLASSAYQLSQSAISPDDWGLVASKWQKAVEQLKQVGGDSSRYGAAQEKVKEYSHNAEYAARQVEILKTTAKTPVAARKLPIAAKPSVLPSTESSSVLEAPKSTSPHKMIVPVVRRLHGTPVVQVTFDGIKTYDMILDTGASRTLITRAMANELGVVATERMIATTASESEVVFELGRVESISMGGITLNNARVSIGDSVSVGLLGNDFLNGYDVTIRSRENVVELVRS